MYEAHGSHNEPQIIPIEGNMYRLLEDFVYIWTINGNPQRITIKKGFEFDGASISLLGTVVTALLPGFQTIYPMGLHIYATLVHDFIWMYKGRLPEGVHERLLEDGTWVDAAYKPNGKRVWTMKTSNKLFIRMLREDKVGMKERRAMYISVQYTPNALWAWHSGKVPEDGRPKRLVV